MEFDPVIAVMLIFMFIGGLVVVIDYFETKNDLANNNCITMEGYENTMRANKINDYRQGCEDACNFVDEFSKVDSSIYVKNDKFFRDLDRLCRLKCLEVI